MGQIKEFRKPTDKALSGMSFRLRIVALDEKDSCYSPMARICSVKHGLDEKVASLEQGGILYIHAHENASFIIACIQDDAVPQGCIALSETHRINSKVCLIQLQEFSVYHGDFFKYDAREGAIGDTSLRPKSVLKLLEKISVDVKYKESNATLRDDSPLKTAELNSRRFCLQLATHLLGSILTTEEVVLMDFEGSVLVCRVTAVVSEGEDGDEIEEATLTDSECFRGLVTPDTMAFVDSSSCTDSPLQIQWASPPEKLVKSQFTQDLVNVDTTDGECFPVRRKALLPCISLTFVVQHGRGKYSHDTPSSNGSAELKNQAGECEETDESDLIPTRVSVSVDACTFDRVLLYLEHERRGEVFHFDPLLANELLNAAEELGVRGLAELCHRVLGSFDERVRRRPVPLDEVMARNAAGRGALSPGAASGAEARRQETLIIIDGMVRLNPWRKTELSCILLL
jgi:hypothetical protein